MICLPTMESVVEVTAFVPSRYATLVTVQPTRRNEPLPSGFHQPFGLAWPVDNCCQPGLNSLVSKWRMSLLTVEGSA